MRYPVLRSNILDSHKHEKSQSGVQYTPGKKVLVSHRKFTSHVSHSRPQVRLSHLVDPPSPGFVELLLQLKESHAHASESYFDV